MTCHCVKALLSIYAWQQNFDVNSETDVSGNEGVDTAPLCGSRPPSLQRGASGVFTVGFRFDFKQPLFGLIYTRALYGPLR